MVEFSNSEEVNLTVQEQLFEAIKKLSENQQGVPSRRN